MVSAVFLPLSWWEPVIPTIESCGSEGEQVPVQVLSAPTDAGCDVLYLTSSISATPCTPPSEPQGPGAQPLVVCATGWLSPKPLIWAS